MHSTPSKVSSAHGRRSATPRATCTVPAMRARRSWDAGGCSRAPCRRDPRPRRRSRTARASRTNSGARAEVEHAIAWPAVEQYQQRRDVEEPAEPLIVGGGRQRKEARFEDSPGYVPGSLIGRRLASVPVPFGRGDPTVSRVVSWSRRLVLVAVALFAAGVRRGFAQDNRIDMVTPAAPELASYGATPSACARCRSPTRTGPNPEYDGGAPTARYDRTLTLEVWYPAALAAGQTARRRVPRHHARSGESSPPARPGGSRRRAAAATEVRSRS